jgi:uncharacterized protein
MKIFSCATLGLLISLTVSPLALVAQSNEGDQILDGIGETALVCRYVFDGNTLDRSRNSRHATLRGTETRYVEDSRFGQVLSLPGGSGGYVEIPGDALKGLDTVSIAGWVCLRSDNLWQRFFDFGPDNTSYFFCTPIGEDAAEGYRARITATGWNEEQGPVAQRIATHTWVHLAVVLDSARHTLSTYADGIKVGYATNVSLNLEQVLNSATANHLYLGKSQFDTDSNLDAKIFDFRIYRIALNDQQVAAIRDNARTGREATAPQTAPSTPKASEATGVSQPQVLPLIAVSNITLDTVQGHLPKLPATVPAVYRMAAYGSRIRVVWPAPTNNFQVRDLGSYTVTGKVYGTEFRPTATVTVKPVSPTAKPRRTLESFPLGQVVLNQDTRQRDTQFIKNRDKFVRTLAESNPDRFLYMFRNAFGEPQPTGAQPLGEWDSQTVRLRGHATGHYLSAIAQAYASSTYDPSLRTNFLHKMNYLIDTLYHLAQKSGKPTRAGGEFNADPTTVPPGAGRSGYDSDLSAQGIRTDYWNWGQGFISAYPPDQFILLEKGATYGGKNDQIWAPYYTLHKILAGLLDCYEVGGNQKALRIAQDMGLWVYQRLKVVPPATRIQMWNRYIAGEYGGMNEAMARLFRITQDRRFLECARLFDNINFFFGDTDHTQGLAKNVDTLRGKHANQHIPQITGALETYRNAADLEYFEVADNFWDICTGSYMYSIGGVAGAKNPKNAECFTAQPDTLYANGFAADGQNETCASYNLLKLSRALFMFKPEARYMDYYERALYNHILASVAENNPGNTYHVPLNPGARKRFGNEHMDGFTCCNGTALESSTKLQDSIYFRGANEKTLYVNLYVPSTLTWKERNVVVTQQTDYPYGDTTRLTLAGGGKFDIKVRVPAWAHRGFFVKINGQEQPIKAVPGTYLTLRRTWKNNDAIELRMPFDFHLSPLMDRPSIASIFYGPVLLAAEEPEPRSQWRPVTLEVGNLGKFIPGDPATLRFQIGNAKLKPFFETYERHSVYFDVTLH